MENPPKVNRTVPYRAVPCSGKAPLDFHEIAGPCSVRLKQYPEMLRLSSTEDAQSESLNAIRLKVFSVFLKHSS